MAKWEISVSESMDIDRALRDPSLSSDDRHVLETAQRNFTLGNRSLPCTISSVDNILSNHRR